jgi:hypothetical protein
MITRKQDETEIKERERERERVICRLKALRMKTRKHVIVEIGRGGLSM